VNTPFTATAVWLRSKGDKSVEVLVEIDKVWRVALTESLQHEGVASHIAEGNGAKNWPRDPLTMPAVPGVTP